MLISTFYSLVKYSLFLQVVVTKYSISDRDNKSHDNCDDSQKYVQQEKGHHPHLRSEIRHTLNY